jgi:16S rRNA (guanine527-N7)-methyltransferase
VRGPDIPISRLQQGLEQLGFLGDASLERRLLHYAHLLARWNRTYNLVSAASASELLERHVFDSLTAHPHVRGSLLDVGTGAGLPGIVLAAADPERECVLLDASSKKTRFCRQAVAELELGNVRVVHDRAETFAPPERFGTVIARGLWSALDLSRWAPRWCRTGGRAIAMKARRSTIELEELCRAGVSARSVKVRIPGFAAERVLIIIENDESKWRMPDDG